MELLTKISMFFWFHYFTNQLLYELLPTLYDFNYSAAVRQPISENFVNLNLGISVLHEYGHIAILVIIILAYLKPNDNYQPTQDEVQNLTYVDKTQYINDYPYPQISRTFKQLSKGK